MRAYVPEYPRYTTYKPGELEQTLRQIAPDSDAAAVADALSEASFSSRSARLLKEHSCAVTYPDKREGQCRYERLGPGYHRFDFTHEDGTRLSREWWSRPLPNTKEAIEHAAEELAPRAFATASERERREYFCRASESHARTKQPDRFQMSAERAKHLAGKYALCQPLDDALVPVSASFVSLEAANEAWQEKSDRRLVSTPAVSVVVACCNRLDRCWERPRFNPLYGEYPDLAHLDPRPRSPAPVPAPVPASDSTAANAPSRMPVTTPVAETAP